MAQIQTTTDYCTGIVRIKSGSANIFGKLDKEKRPHLDILRTLGGILISLISLAIASASIMLLTTVFGFVITLPLRLFMDVSTLTGWFAYIFRLGTMSNIINGFIWAGGQFIMDWVVAIIAARQCLSNK